MHRINTEKSLPQYESEDGKLFWTYTFDKQKNEFKEPKLIRLTALNLTKIIRYQLLYEELPAYSDETNLELHYTDTDSFALSFETEKLVPDLEILPEKFDTLDFSNLKNILIVNILQ